MIINMMARKSIRTLEASADTERALASSFRMSDALDLDTDMGYMAAMVQAQLHQPKSDSLGVYRKENGDTSCLTTSLQSTNGRQRCHADVYVPRLCGKSCRSALMGDMNSQEVWRAGMACPFQVERLCGTFSSSAVLPHVVVAFAWEERFLCVSLLSVSSSRLCQSELRDAAQTRSVERQPCFCSLRDEAGGTFRLRAVWYHLPCFSNEGISATASRLWDTCGVGMIRGI